MIKNVFLLFGLVVFGVTSCKTLDPVTMPTHMKLGQTYYTQYSLKYEKGRHRTTNYRKGMLLPVNSEVTLTEIDRKRVYVTIGSSGQELIIENVPKHTNTDSYQAFNRIFAENKVNLSGFTAAERNNIMSGSVAKGMRKKAVLIAIGPPPEIETPNLEMNQWKYWANRWNTYILHFEEDRVARIQD